LKNIGPIRHNEPPHAHSPDVASGTVARRLRIDVHDNANDDNDDNDNAWPTGPLWPNGMGTKIRYVAYIVSMAEAHQTWRHKLFQSRRVVSSGLYPDTAPCW